MSDSVVHVRLPRAGRVAASIVAVAVVTLLYRNALQVNPTTIALSYLVVILFIASGWGIAEATTASVAAVLCFNFFFLPPVGTLTIADPQNWIALVAFLLTAIVVSQLSGRARRRTLEAVVRQRDLERLYALSRALLLSEHGSSVPGSIARHVATAFEVPTVGLYDQRTDQSFWTEGGESPARDMKLREVARRAASVRDPSGVIVVAVQLGGAPIGSVALTDAGLSDTVLQSIANLVAIGLERARADEATVRAEAARESSELRATILDALAHEFKTPLTAMKAASSDLRSSQDVSARSRELATIVDEDVDRLQSLVTDAVHMLRIDAGDFAVNLGRHSLAVLVDDTVRRFEQHFDGRSVSNRVPGELTVDADRDLLALALRQLLDNAIKYSPPSATIDISADSNGAVGIAVHNTGSTISARDQGRILDRFYRGAQARHIPGTGMGLAIVRQIAAAHGGTLSVSSAPSTGTTFTMSLPRGGRA